MKREEAGITQQALARATKVSIRTVNALENGTTGGLSSTVEAIAGALGADIHWLMTGKVAR